MAEEKREWKFFTIMEYEEEQEYLREKHKEGWKFIKATGLGMYHFEKCEPEDVVYQLDYNQEGREHMDEYVQMFCDCGWEYVRDFFGYSYFRKPAAEMDGEESIFCDDESRLDMMRRIFKGRMVPILIIFIGVLIPALIREFADGGTPDFGIIAIIVLALVIWTSIFVRYWVKYRQYKMRLGR